MTDDTPLRLFIGYAHADEASKDRLRTNLAPVVRKGLVELWDDFAIPAGDELGRLLAVQAALTPTAVLLDGLEPLQRAAPGDEPP